MCYGCAVTYCDNCQPFCVDCGETFSCVVCEGLIEDDGVYFCQECDTTSEEQT